MSFQKTHHKGISAVEMLVGVSILAVVFVAITFSISQFINTARDVAHKTQALYLAEEVLEMVRFIRDDAWSNIGGLTDNTTYYLDISGPSITTTATPEVIGIFTRSFEIDSVERNGSDDIISSGTPDADSKYVTATVSWGTPTTTVSLTTLLADIKNP